MDYLDDWLKSTIAFESSLENAPDEIAQAVRQADADLRAAKQRLYEAIAQQNTQPVTSESSLNLLCLLGKALFASDRFMYLVVQANEVHRLSYVQQELTLSIERLNLRVAEVEQILGRRGR